MTLKSAVVVDARYMPDDVLDYCGDNDITTHCDNALVWIEDDGNPLAEWLKKNGYEFQAGKDGIYGDYVGVLGS